MRGRNFIAGEWRDSRAGRWHDVSDPASGVVFCRVPDSGQADAKGQLIAHAALMTGARYSPARGSLLKRWHALIVATPRIWRDSSPRARQTAA